MEPPASFEADAVRDEKSKLLRAIQQLALGRCAVLPANGQTPAEACHRNCYWVQAGSFAAVSSDSMREAHPQFPDYPHPA